LASAAPVRDGFEVSLSLVEVPVSLASASVNAGVAVLILLEQSKWAILLLVVIAAVAATLYRAYARFLRQHKSLADIYELTRAVAEHTYDGTLIDVLLRQVRGLLHAESSTLWLAPQGRYPEVLLSARADDKGLLDLSSIGRV